MLNHKFVEFIPRELEEGIIYVSIPFGTVVHNCACGCQSKVVTPLTPTDWKVTFDGETVSLYPSIGSWGLECKSHYWIENNQIIWSYKWSKEQIESGRRKEILEKEVHYRTPAAKETAVVSNGNWWSKLKKWFCS